MSNVKPRKEKYIALGLGILGATFWLWWLYFFRSEMDMFNAEMFTAFIPYIAIFIAWRKNIIGGWLVAISGFTPLVIFLILYLSNPSLFLGFGIILWSIPLFLTVTVPLLFSGIYFNSHDKKTETIP
jgi:hypothetical protein